MKRGEIRWYEFNLPDKKRPVLILTRNSIIPFINEITIAPVTSTIRNIPSEVFLSKDEGMVKDCAVNFDHIQTVSKNKIGPLITQVSRDKLEEIRQALSFALGL